MRRKIAIALASFLSLLVVGSFAFVWWLSSTHFDNFVRKRLSGSLARLGLRTDVEHLDAHPFRLEIQISGLRLYPGSQAVPMLALQKLRAKFNMKDLWSRQLVLRELELEEPQVFISFDERGRSNLDEIDLSLITKRGAAERYTLDIAYVSVRQGSVAFQHEKYSAGFTARHVKITVAPGSPMFRIEAQASNCDVKVGNGLWGQQGLRIEFSGALEKDNLRIERIRILGEAIDLLASGSLTDWDRPRYELAVSSTIDVGRLSYSLQDRMAFSGEMSFRGRVFGEGPSYQAEGVISSPEVRLWGIQLAELMSSGSIEALGTDQGKRTTSSITTTAGLLTASILRAREVSLKSDMIWGSPGFALSGEVGLRRGSVGPIPYEDFRGLIHATPEQIRFDGFTARLLGGSLVGRASVNLAGSSDAAVSLEGVDFSRLVRAFLHRELPVSGSARGSLSLRWPALDVQRLSGTIAMDVSGGALEIPERLPAAGQVLASLRPEGIEVDVPRFTMGRSVAKVSGNVAWKGDLSLRFDVTSENLAEEERLLEAFGYSVKELSREIVPELSGRGKYELKLIKEGKRFLVSGSGEWSGFIAAGEKVTSFQTDLEYTDGLLRLDRAHMQWESGGRANFSLTYLIGEEDGISLNGRLNQVNLARQGSVLQEKLPVSGLITGSVNFTHLPSRPEGSADVVVTDGEMILFDRRARFKRLSGRFRVNGSRYELENASAFFDDGQIVLFGWVDSSRGEYKLSGKGVELGLSRFTESLRKYGVSVDGRLGFDFSGEGKLAEPYFSADVHAVDVAISGKPAGRIDAEARGTGAAVEFKVVSTLFGQTEIIEGALDLNSRDQIVKARTELDRFNLTPYLNAIKGPRDLSAVLSGGVNIEWSLAEQDKRRVMASVAELEIRFGDYLSKSRKPFGMDFSSTRLKIEPVVLEGENTNLEISGVMDLGGVIGRRSEQPVSELNVTGRIDLRLLRAFYPDLFTTGWANMRAVIRGSFDQPRLSGIMEIEGASLRMMDIPVSLASGKGRIRFTADQALIENLSAEVNGGGLSVAGGLVLKNLKADRWRLTMKAEGVHINYPSGLRSLIDGDLVLQGNRQIQVLSGTLSVRRSEYTEDVDLARLILSSGEGPRQPSIGVRVSPPVNLDVYVQALDTVSVKNNLSDAVGSAWLHIGGSLEDPKISGNAVVSRGTIRFRNRDYQITRGRIDFPREAEGKPRFNVETEADILGYRVIVGLIGTLDKFQTTLRSEPALPVEGIISLITTGDVNQPLLQTQTGARSGLGSAANFLVGELTHRAEQFTGKFFGINRFQVDPLIVGRGSDPTARVTVGRQITRDLSILYSTNISSTQEQVMILEYHLSHRFSLVGVRDQDGNFSFDLRIRKRF